MKLYAIFASLMFAAASAQECGKGYWSADGNLPCHFACSPGCGDAGCNKVGGACLGASCVDGWQDAVKNSKKCDSPKCNFERNGGASGCANGGKCIAPNECICGQSGAQIVAKEVQKANGDADGKDCVSLRKDGIIGAFIALCVMTVSVSFCGLTERHLTKKKNAAKSA